MGKTLSVFSLNCRSIDHNWQSFRDLIADMSTDNFSFSVIGLTEIFTVHDESNVVLKGYHKFEYKERPKNDDGRGGVGFFIKDHLVYEIKKEYSVFIPHIIETMFIEIKNIIGKPIIIGIIYRPNTFPKADLDVFIKTMTDIIELLNDEGKRVILMGDFNVDLLKFDVNSKTNDFINDIFSNGFLPLITKPTRITSHSATLIDHIHTNILDRKYTSGIIITDIADHFGVYSTFCLKTEKTNTEPKTVRIFNNLNITRFKDALRYKDYSEVYETENTNEAYNTFLNIYIAEFESCFPPKTVYVKNKYVKHEPWLTTGLLNSSLNRVKLYKKKLQNPSETNVNKYITFCTLFNKLKRIAKSSYYTNKINHYKNDSKQSWKILNKLINKSKTKNELPSHFLIDKKSISNKIEIANSFNKFFTEIGPRIRDEIGVSNTNFKRHLTRPFNQTFFLNPVCQQEIIEICASLKPKTSCGHDNISTKLIKDTIHEISEPLTHIFNTSFASGIVPDSFKQAKIIPIFKLGDTKIFNNYRPISLLPAFSKLIEKVVYKQLYHFLNKNNLFYKHQYGFRKQHSTLHPILHLLKHIAEFNDKPTKDLTIGIFLDLSKAFDTLSHDIMLEKLKYYGIRGHGNNWFRSYLSDRCQFTEINSVKSDILPITCGVPQGSILGPLLFLIYINDFPLSTNLHLLSFADDTTVYTSGHNIFELTTIVNHELSKLYDWLCENKLSLNVQKTKYMIFSAKSISIPNNIVISLNNNQLSRVGANQNETSLKFLGVSLTENLNWKSHINTLCSKVSKGLYSINKVKNVLPHSALRNLYYALIHCHFNYCIPIWGNSPSLEKLFKLQKRAVRIINKTSYRAHTDPLFKADNILKLTDLYKLSSSLLIFDYKHDRLPISFNNYFSYPNRHTRQFLDVHTNVPRTDFSAMSPFHSIPKHWNNLLNNVKDITSRPLFINSLKNDFIDNYLDIVFCDNPRCTQCH